MRGGHVFISHASDETGSAQELARLLRASALDVWLDVERLKPGDRWMSGIEAAIRDAAAVVVFVGASGIRAWVEMEFRCALEREVKERRGPVQERPFRLILILGRDSDPASLPYSRPGINTWIAVPVCRRS